MVDNPVDGLSDGPVNGPKDGLRDSYADGPADDPADVRTDVTAPPGLITWSIDTRPGEAVFITTPDGCLWFAPPPCNHRSHSPGFPAETETETERERDRALLAIIGKKV